MDAVEIINGCFSDEVKNRVFAQESCCIDPTFYGAGIDNYLHLSMILPKHFTIIDLGCSYASQSCFFKDFKSYIGVNPESDVSEFFRMDNTTIYKMTTGEFIRDVLPTLGLDMRSVFAIANYVPDWYKESTNKLVRDTFSNMFVFYPHVKNIGIKFR